MADAKEPAPEATVTREQLLANPGPIIERAVREGSVLVVDEKDGRVCGLIGFPTGPRDREILE